MRRVTAAINRTESSQRRSNWKGRNVTRTERTRHLIELGGLVVKARLVELFDDDRTALYGAMLGIAEVARETPDAVRTWRRRGGAEFDASAAPVKANVSR